MKRLGLLVIWIVCNVAHIITAIWMLCAIIAGSNRAWKLAISYDQLANTAFGGNQDETISSRAAKAASKDKKWGCVLCKLLDKLDRGHCQRVIELDEK